MDRRRSWPRRVKRIVLPTAAAAMAAIVALFTLGVMANQVMMSWGRVYASGFIESLPRVDAALVLGTLPFQPPGELNPFLGERLTAAAELWRAGKVRYLIVSGNRDRDLDYDEPTAMRDALVEFGVPSGVIYRDYYGFRTVDSVVRARDIYGQRRLIIVSQAFHVERAVFLARHLGIEAWGYHAEDDDTSSILPSFGRGLVLLYAYWDLVAGPRRVTGPRVVIGVDPPV